jgi:hypothetical protein
MTPAAIRGLIAAVIFAGATALAGWWSVPALALLAGAIIPRRSGDPLVVALAGAAAWAGLLLWDAAGGALGTLLHRLGALLQVPVAAPIVVTLLFPAALAWSGWATGRIVARQ